MLAHKLAPEGLVRHEESPPELAADEVRVRVEAVCLEPEDLRRAGDCAPGGGLCGVVQECGSAATALAGARVLLSPVVPCGECDTCRQGFATVCPSRRLLGGDVDGGCAESVVAAARWITRLDGGLELDAEQGALVAGPALTAYALYCRAGVSSGEVVVILGCGPRAAILSKIARGRGARVLTAHGAEAPRYVEQELRARDAGERPQRIFVCDGADNASAAMEIATPGSVVVTCLPTGSIDVEVLCARELSLLGVPFGHPDLLPEAAALVAKGELDLSDLGRRMTVGPSAPAMALEAFEEGRCLVLSHEDETREGLSAERQ